MHWHIVKEFGFFFFVEASHKFTESANDWGFTQFVAVRDLSRGFVVNDTLTVKVRIALEEDRYQRAQEARQLTG